MDCCSRFHSLTHSLSCTSLLTYQSHVNYSHTHTHTHTPAHVGKHVRDSAQALAAYLDEQITEFGESILRPTNEVEELEFVLNVLANVKERAMEIELKFKSVLDAYDLLDAYVIPHDAEEFEFACALPDKWQQLLDDAEDLEGRLAPIKERFKDVCFSLCVCVCFALSLSHTHACIRTHTYI